MEWEKILANDVTNKFNLQKTHSSYNLTASRKQTTQSKNGQKN